MIIIILLLLLIMIIVYTAVYFRQLTRRDKSLADWGQRFGGQSRRQEFLSVLGRGVWPLWGVTGRSFRNWRDTKPTAGKVLILLKESSKTDFPTTKNMGCLITSFWKKQMLVSWTPEIGFQAVLAWVWASVCGVDVQLWRCGFRFWAPFHRVWELPLQVGVVSTTQPSVGVDWQKGVGKEKRHPGIFLKKRFKTTNSRGVTLVPTKTPRVFH